MILQSSKQSKGSFSSKPANSIDNLFASAIPPNSSINPSLFASYPVQILPLAIGCKSCILKPLFELTFSRNFV